MRWYRYYSAGVCIFTIVRYPRERAIRPRESLYTPPAHRVGHRHPFFRRVHRDMMCGGGVEPLRGRWRPIVVWICYTKMFLKIHLDISIIITITFTTEHYISRMYYMRIIYILLVHVDHSSRVLLFH